MLSIAAVSCACVVLTVAAIATAQAARDSVLAGVDGSMRIGLPHEISHRVHYLRPTDSEARHSRLFS